MMTILAILFLVLLISGMGYNAEGWTGVISIWIGIILFFTALVAVMYLISLIPKEYSQ